MSILEKPGKGDNLSKIYTLTNKSDINRRETVTLYTLNVIESMIKRWNKEEVQH